MTLCGALNVGFGHAPLICNLDAQHAGPHGIRQLPTLPPYVTWGPLVDESGLLSTRLTVTAPLHPAMKE